MALRAIAFCLFGGNVIACAAAPDSTRLHLTVYADVYSSIKPKANGSHTAGANIYSYHRVNELALNMALLDASWQVDKRTTLNVGLMTGTYAQANLSNEPDLFRFVYEANVVYALMPQHGLTLQAGIFPSHIGMESAIGIQNPTLTRSLQADNSPYYESGLKLTKAIGSDRGELAVLLLNGWQQIARNTGQTRPAVGHQFWYKPHSKWVFNSSSFIGNMDWDSLGRTRYFHDAWLQYTPNEHWMLAGGFDIGNQRRGAPQFGGRWWSTLQVLAQYKVTSRLKACARWERVNDFHQVVFTWADIETHRLHGYSLNTDYALSERLHWRTEVRCLKQQYQVSQWYGTVSLLCYFKKSVS